MTGRVVIVTGASSGIGQACANRLHRAGWSVVGASRRGTSDGEWRAVRMDVDDDGSVADVVATVIEDHGRVDAVVACAGWALAGAVEETPIADARAQLETNFWGAVRLVQAVLPAMRSRGGGRIVLVSSIAGQIGVPFQTFYSASKFALEGFGEALAYEVAPFGIGVTLVEPGNTRTAATDNRRHVGSRGPDSPYGAATRRAVGRMESDERSGPGPDVVAAAVEEVLTARRAPRRVSVGRRRERSALLAKRFLPHAAFERLAAGSLAGAPLRGPSGP